MRLCAQADVRMFNGNFLGTGFFTQFTPTQKENLGNRMSKQPLKYSVYRNVLEGEEDTKEGLKKKRKRRKR